MSGCDWWARCKIRSMVFEICIGAWRAVYHDKHIITLLVEGDTLLFVVVVHRGLVHVVLCCVVAIIRTIESKFFELVFFAKFSLEQQWAWSCPGNMNVDVDVVGKPIHN